MVAQLLQSVGNVPGSNSNSVSNSKGSKGSKGSDSDQSSDKHGTARSQLQHWATLGEGASLGPTTKLGTLGQWYRQRWEARAPCSPPDLPPDPHSDSSQGLANGRGPVWCEMGVSLDDAPEDTGWSGMVLANARLMSMSESEGVVGVESAAWPCAHHDKYGLGARVDVCTGFEASACAPLSQVGSADSPCAGVDVWPWAHSHSWSASIVTATLMSSTYVAWMDDVAHRLAGGSGPQAQHVDNAFGEPTLTLDPDTLYVLVGPFKDIFSENTFHILENFRALQRFFEGRVLPHATNSGWAVHILIAAAPDPEGNPHSAFTQAQVCAFIKAAYEAAADGTRHALTPSTPFRAISTVIASWDGSNIYAGSPWTARTSLIVPHLVVFNMLVSLVDSRETDLFVPRPPAFVPLPEWGGARTPLIRYDPVGASVGVPVGAPVGAPAGATLVRDRAAALDRFQRDRVAFARYVHASNPTDDADEAAARAALMQRLERPLAQQGRAVEPERVLRIGFDARETASRRVLRNKAAVLAAVQARAQTVLGVQGVELVPVDMGALSLPQQLRVFDACSNTALCLELDVLVAVHGAGMWATFFARPGTGLVQLNTRGATVSNELGQEWHAHTRNRTDSDYLARSLYWRNYPAYMAASGSPAYTVPWPDSESPAFSASTDSLGNLTEWMAWVSETRDGFPNPFLQVNYPSWIELAPGLVAEAVALVLAGGGGGNGGGGQQP